MWPMQLPTPLERAPAGLAPGWDAVLKREDVHELGAFKWRGALATLERFASHGATSVVTASTGNHGAATAWAASRLGMEAVVYAPRGASRAKTALIERLGAELRLVGADLDEAKDEARQFAHDRAVPFFEDGAEPAQLTGYGAIADELLDQLGRDPAAVVVPLGNGALLGGIGMRMRDRAPGAKVVGVVAGAAPVMAWSLAAGRPVDCDRCDTFADGLAVRVAIPYAVDTLAPLVDGVVEVSERELADAVGSFAAAGLRVEGAAGASLAGLRRLGALDGPVVLIVTGRNIDDELFESVVQHPDRFP
jgi:threonine dehydratase